MVTQSEQVLENGLIKTLMEMNYEYISIKEEDNLYANFKKQLEKHNKRELSLHKRKHFTDKEWLSCNTWGIKFSQFPSCIYLC